MARLQDKPRNALIKTRAWAKLALAAVSMELQRRLRWLKVINTNKLKFCIFKHSSESNICIPTSVVITIPSEWGNRESKSILYGTPISPILEIQIQILHFFPLWITDKKCTQLILHSLPTSDLPSYNMEEPVAAKSNFLRSVSCVPIRSQAPLRLRTAPACKALIWDWAKPTILVQEKRSIDFQVPPTRWSDSI